MEISEYTTRCGNCGEALRRPAEDGFITCLKCGQDYFFPEYYSIRWQ